MLKPYFAIFQKLTSGITMGWSNQVEDPHQQTDIFVSRRKLENGKLRGGRHWPYVVQQQLIDTADSVESLQFHKSGSASKFGTLSEPV